MNECRKSISTLELLQESPILLMKKQCSKTRQKDESYVNV
jgi:hypothetical protein